MTEQDLEQSRRRGPGRPQGLTRQGRETKQRLFEIALSSIGRDGFQQTTLRKIAEEAKVSPGLLYRYFPGKDALVLEFYNQLSAEFEEAAQHHESGTWPQRFIGVLDISLETLQPHRTTLEALVPILISRGKSGLFSSSMRTSRERIEDAFVVAVTESNNAPRGKSGAALGRLLYLLHMATILWWILDRSTELSTTKRLTELLGKLLSRLAPALRLPPLRRAILTADRLYREGLVEA